MTADIVRWLVIFACYLNVGAMVLLFQRVGRFFVPSTWMRLLAVGNAVVMVAIAVIIGSHLGHAIAWKHALLAVGAVAELVALVGLWHWYGTTTGRAHAAWVLRREMVPSPADGAIDLPARVRHLGVAMFALYTIALLVGLVVLVVVVRMHSALCSYRSDLGDRASAGQAQIERGHDYVFGNKAEHLPPHPGVVFGLSHAQVLANLAAAQKTVDSQHRAYRSLRGLYC